MQQTRKYLGEGLLTELLGKVAAASGREVIKGNNKTGFVL